LPQLAGDIHCNRTVASGHCGAGSQGDRKATKGNTRLSCSCARIEEGEVFRYEQHITTDLTRHRQSVPVSRDVQNFDLLIEIWNQLLGEAGAIWASSEKVLRFFSTEAATLELIALALDSKDEENLPMMSEIIAQAKAVISK